MRFSEAALSCPIPGAVELIGEKWAFLILRGALNGLQHFEEFQAGLGIARNILSDRLGKLVAGGILERRPTRRDRRKVVYALTDKGEALLPVVLALRQWGEDWGHGTGRGRACRPPRRQADAPDLRAGPRRPRRSSSGTDVASASRRIGNPLRACGSEAAQITSTE